MAVVPQLRIEKSAVSDLIPYINNSKEHPDWQVKQIAASIDQFGMDDPIAVWTNADGGLEIVEGHGRLLACKELGIDEVPIIKLDHLDDDARRAYSHVHNNLTMNTGFDLEKLNADMAELSQFDWGDWGFEKFEELESLDSIEEDEVPISVETRCKAGDVWQLGEHRLVCGDSTDPETVKHLMGDELADLLLTDPPYGVDYVSKNIAVHKYKLGAVNGISEDSTILKQDIEGDTLSKSELQTFLSKAFSPAFASMRDGAAFYVWYASINAEAFLKALASANASYRHQLVWVKPRLVFGRQDYHYQHEPCLYGWKPGAAHYFAPTHKETSVFDSDKPIDKMTKDELLATIKAMLDGIEPDVLRYDKPLRSELHPTMKPVALFAHLIRNSSRPGEKVLDIFAGSGTTLVACEQLGRKARLVEYDPHYCDVIIERWEQLTGGTAVKLD